MPELQLLRDAHDQAVLAFEVANRSYFAASISDRGDAYFREFTTRHRSLLEDQASGGGAYYVLVGDDGSVLGRFNLVFVGGSTAELGYRVAEEMVGRGVATAAVRELCALAAGPHGVRRLRAATADANTASQRVLVKAGFVRIGPADPDAIGGKTGAWYELGLDRGGEP